MILIGNHYNMFFLLIKASSTQYILFIFIHENLINTYTMSDSLVGIEDTWEEELCPQGTCSFVGRQTCEETHYNSKWHLLKYSHL